MPASRIACVGSVRFIALGAAVIGVVTAVAHLIEEPPPVIEPYITCVIPEIKPGPALEVLSADPIDEHPTCSCTPTVAGKLSVEQHRTLELACRLYSDESCRYPFELFATPQAGSKTAVVVKRSTGDCGGCGALTIAAVFDHGTLEAIGQLGTYGRFGNGPDAARWVTVAGEPTIELAWSESNHGYSHEYREVFLRDGDGFRSGACMQTAFDDRGAREKPTEWRARLDYQRDGAIDIHYTAIAHGEAVMPDLTTTRLQFDRAHRVWARDRAEDGCTTPADPHLDDVLID